MMSNKVVVTPAQAGPAYWVMGDLFTFLATGEETGGNNFTEVVSIGPGNGPPPHIHHLEDESFYILEGEITFQVGEQVHTLCPGDFLYIPRDTVHSFKNGPKPARVLATFSPAGIEKFFQAVGDPVEDRNAPPPPVTQETIARLLTTEANGWKDHHYTLPPQK
ncbi:MAG TPA: quercetin 2,3-dioxygenase [Anaerolinea sp.]|nr:quercetin 2,3-dioxygenase [Anaerolinea sp.]